MIVNCKYKNILKYISYFESASQQSYTWESTQKDADDVISIGYRVYEETFTKFISEVYDSGVLLSEYTGHLPEHISELEKEKISQLDLVKLRVVLTFFVRVERFQDGVWAQAITNQSFLHIFKRLSELTDR
ncbi:DUF6508 domain-containing protein [Alkalihalobacterium alkalicellulosilyticum]|uniref:DUF6508 domain-containing protein n=1 Tax=Alkalihalobacterium alkalicellulosilyticum TaxID=1912214 RepID=UPI003AF0408A